MQGATQTKQSGGNPFAALSAHSDGSLDAHIEETRTFVTFELAEQWLAIDVAYVREILDRQTVTPLPRAATDVEGVIDVRGNSVVVVDLSRKLGIAPSVETEDTRFLVFEFSGANEDAKPIAVRADKVLEVSQIPDADIERPPEDSPEWSRNLVMGVTRSNDRLVMLIDLVSIFPQHTGDVEHGDDIFKFD